MGTNTERLLRNALNTYLVCFGGIPILRTMTTHTYKHKNIQINTHIQIHTQTHKQLPTLIYIHTTINTYTHIYTNTHAQTHVNIHNDNNNKKNTLIYKNSTKPTHPKIMLIIIKKTQSQYNTQAKTYTYI